MRVLSYRALRRSAAWAAAFAAWSCGTTSNEVINDVASVVVTPGSVTLQVGQILPLQAAVNDASGRAVSAAVYWSVRDRSIVTISPAGLVTAVAVGTTEISANANGKSGLASITVQRAPVASVVVLPLRADALVGARSTFTAVAYDQSGNQLTGRTFLWSSSNAVVATVDATGVVTAVGPGTATITATSEGKSNSATITVAAIPVATVTLTPAIISLAPAQTATVTATARDAAGNVITGRTVQWSSSSPGVASVSQNGTVTTIADGTATITATIGEVSGIASVVVSSAPVGSVTVQPTSVSIDQNATQQLTATVRDVDGVIRPRPVTWATSNAAIATVSQSGLVTGITPGTVTITATREGVSGTATMTVLRTNVAAVTVQPSISSIRPGTTIALTATPRDAAGATLIGRTITWATSSAPIATVSAAGSVTGVAAGRATITATVDGVNGTATVDVGLPVATVTVAPATSNVNVGMTVTLVPTVRDANGTATTDRPVAWTSNAPSIATVSASGVVTGVTGGTTTISATSEGRTGSATVTVVVPPVATVTVQPATLTLLVGETTTLTTVTRDADGNVLAGRLVTWSLGEEIIATVTAAGVVRGVSAGTTTIVATSEGKTGTALVTVSTVPVASVTVQPTTATVAVGATTALTAFTRDASGNVLSGRVVTWTSNTPAVATVNASGVVTGVSRGSAIITATSDGKTGTATITVP